MIYYADYPSPIGHLRLLVKNTQLIGLEFERERQILPLDAQIADETSGQVWAFFCKIFALLDHYFAGIPVNFSEIDFLAPQGTAFQQAVWQKLREIPYGETTSYGEIAQALNKPKAVRAVGGAVGRNPISILIPCHRVLGKNQALTGFGGGLPCKRFLLELEKISYRDLGIEFVKSKTKKLA